MPGILYRAASISPLRLLAGGLAILIVVSILDYITGYELRFYVFYFPSVAIVSWSGRRNYAVGITLLGTLILLLQQYFAGFPYSHFFYGYWATAVGGLAFTFVALLAFEARELFEVARVKNEQLLRANEKLARTANELSTLLDVVPAAIFVADGAECRNITGNELAHSILGLPLASNLSASDTSGNFPRNYRVLRDGEEIPVSLRPMQLAARGESQLDCTFDLMYDNGVLRTLLGNAVALMDSHGEPGGAVGAFIDITDRKRLEDELARSLAYKNAALSSAIDAVCIFDSSGKITDTSDSCRDFMRFGSEDCAPETFEAYLQCMELYTAEGAVVPPDQWLLPRTLRGERGANIEYGIRRNDTGEFWSASFSFGPILREDGTLIGGMLVARDITALKRLQQDKMDLELRMHRSEKLESLGLLAGGIAHTFNNQLQAILAGCEMVTSAIPVESPARSIIATVQSSAVRAAAVARHMLDYSGHGHFTLDLLSLNSFVSGVVSGFSQTLSGKVKLDECYGSDLPVTRVDKRQIERLLINILSNAQEAIGDQPGAIHVTTGMVVCDEDFLEGLNNELYPEDLKTLRPGKYAFLQVSDTGPGMDIETIRKIFDPFFSTKFLGRGLGLATVLGIVRGHRGAIDVRSEPGNGTTMRVLFSAVDIGHAAA